MNRVRTSIRSVVKKGGGGELSTNNSSNGIGNGKCRARERGDSWKSLKYTMHEKKALMDEPLS